MALDDIVVRQQGNSVNPKSIMQIVFIDARPDVPAFEPMPEDRFIRGVAAARKKWVVLSDQEDQPRLLPDAGSFLRDVFVLKQRVCPDNYCHPPAVVSHPQDTLDKAISSLARLRNAESGHNETVILFWSKAEKRMITGSDVLRCLLKGMRHQGQPVGVKEAV